MKLLLILKKIIIALLIFLVVLTTALILTIVYYFWQSKNTIGKLEKAENYIPIEQISPILQDAIVATEDQTFWSNNIGNDYGVMGFFKTLGSYLDVHRLNSFDGSVITTQLIKNVYLTNERSNGRVFKEIIVYFALHDYLRDQIKQSHPQYGEVDINQEVKKKVLELYLNYIFLGNNSYGVESASNNYFATGAANLNILESAVLAGIPQAPGRYNVYTNRDEVMGYLSVVDSLTDEEVILDDVGKQELYIKASTILSQEDVRGSSANDVINYLRDSLNFDYNYGSGSYTVQYKLGRKDEVLARMYDTNFITTDELKQAILQGFTYEFKKANTY